MVVNYNIDFEIAAIVIDIIIILLYYQRRSLPSASNIFYRRIMVIALASCVSNVIAVKLLDMGSSVPVWLNYAANIVYSILQNILPGIFVLYTAAFLEVKKRISKRLYYIEGGIIIFIIIALVTTPFTHFAFSFNAKGEYLRGAFVYVLYVLAVIQFALISVIAFAQQKKITAKNKVYTIYAFVILLTAAVIIQLVFSQMLVTGFANTCACLIMYMVLQGPNGSRDETTGLYRRNAFFAAVTESYISEKGFTVISVILNNAENIITAMGRKTYTNYVSKIGEFLTSQYMVELFCTEDNSITFILDNPVDVENVFENIKKRFRQPWSVDGMSINGSCNFAYTGYPSPLKSVEDIVPAVDFMISKVKNHDEESPFFANDIPKINDKLGELEAEKRLLEAETKEAAEAKERAERENKQKNVFLANMSHEIRTPMNAILGMTELVLRDDVNPRVRDMVEEIQRSGESLLAIMNDLLDVTKIESDKFELESKEFSLKTVISDALSISYTRISSPDIDMLVEIGRNVPDMVIGDENRLKQVFVNILNNACKYTKRGHIKLEVTGDYKDDKFLLYTSVEDTGTGIKNQDKRKLFNSFSRALNEENANVEGTGLGLAICKKIVTFMGGDIDFESSFGVGSRFFFEVPLEVKGDTAIINASLPNSKVVFICVEDRYDHKVDKLKSIMFELDIPYYVVTSLDELKANLEKYNATDLFITRQMYDQSKALLKKSEVRISFIYNDTDRYDDVTDAGILYEPIYVLSVQKLLEERRSEKSAQKAYVAPEGSKILVVDDNLVNLKVITSLLKQFGVAADTAKSGVEAINMAGVKKYDLIFMDHMMPEMDGIEAMKNIRSLSPVHRRMPIVMLTANAVNGAEKMFLEHKFDEYVSKPVSMERLEQVLRKFL